MSLSKHNTIAVGSAYGSPTCEIITIGTELLLGQIVDTNTTYLAQELGRAGVNVRFLTAVGDHLEEIIEILACAIERCDVVVTTGGLGPTLDDLTREAVARTTGLELEFRQDLMEEIERIFRQFGYQMPENNRRQAFVPAGSQIIPNPVGTAPAFITEVSGKAVVCLPGVPRELKFLLKKEVIHWLERRFDMSAHRLTYQVLKVVGLGESRVDQLIGDLIRSGQNPEVGLLASQGEIKIRIAARAGNDSEAQTLIGPIEKEIRSRLGNRIFGEDKDTLEGVIGRLLAKKGLTLSTFETFTGGMAAQRLHHFPSSQITKCTVITDKKSVAQWLDHNNMEQVDETAAAIARKLQNGRQKEVGLAILGFPVKREEGYSVKGCTAVAGEGIERSFSWRMGGDLNTLQHRGTVIGLNTLRLSLLEYSDE